MNKASTDNLRRNTIDLSTIVAEYFKTPLSIIDRTSQNIEDWITINWHSQNNPTTKQYIFFSSTHDIITKIDHMLIHIATILKYWISKIYVVLFAFYKENIFKRNLSNKLQEAYPMLLGDKI